MTCMWWTGFLIIAGCLCQKSNTGMFILHKASSRVCTQQHFCKFSEISNVFPGWFCSPMYSALLFFMCNAATLED